MKFLVLAGMTICDFAVMCALSTSMALGIIFNSIARMFHLTANMMVKAANKLDRVYAVFSDRINDRLNRQ